MIEQLSDSYMQRCRVAANLFFRYRSSFRISFSDSPFYDLIIVDPSNELTFGVIVVSQDFMNTDEFKQKISQNFKNYSKQNRSTMVPVLLMRVDEQNEFAECAVIMSIDWNGARFNHKLVMREVNEDNLAAIMNDINMADYCLRALCDNTYGVLKTISFKLPIIGEGITEAWAKVVYKRNFTEYYRMNSPEVVDEQERFNRLLHGTPQEEYPSDYLDKLISEAISNWFKVEVEVINSLFLFNFDLKNLRTEYGSLLKKQLTIQVEPELDEAMQMFGGLINCPRINLTMFLRNDLSKYSFNTGPIMHTVPAQKWAWVYEQVTKLKPTLTDLKKIIE